MWKIKIEDNAALIFESDLLTDDDKIVIQKWAETIIMHGPEGLLVNPSVWSDHPLYGDWWGCRSSSFSYKGRIIYKIQNQIVTVVVLKITNDHDYKKV